MNQASVMLKKKTVSFIVAGMPQYREKFHILNKERLNKLAVNYKLFVSKPKYVDKKKGDQVNILWSNIISDLRLRILNHEFIFQLPPFKILKSDLIIVINENSYFLNYLLVVIQPLFRYKLAFFGHGKNYQAKNKNTLPERWKKWWLNKCDWWFTYTDGSAENIILNGFPKNKITVINNSIDTSNLKESIDKITPEEIEQFKSEFQINSDNIGIFIGGIYEDKRLDFLIEAAIRVRNKIPDFILLICGNGPKLKEIIELARQFKWIIFTGAIFNKQKSIALKISKILLMPGLVGLVVLDAFITGLPLITTELNHHSPEIEYLRAAGSGIIISLPNDPETYANEIIQLIKDEKRITKLKENALIASNEYTVESMSFNFCNGIQSIVNNPKINFR